MWRLLLCDDCFFCWSRIAELAALLNVFTLCVMQTHSFFSISRRLAMNTRYPSLFQRASALDSRWVPTQHIVVAMVSLFSRHPQHFIFTTVLFKGQAFVDFNCSVVAPRRDSHSHCSNCSNHRLTHVPLYSLCRGWVALFSHVCDSSSPYLLPITGSVQPRDSQGVCSTPRLARFARSYLGRTCPTHSTSRARASF